MAVNTRIEVTVNFLGLGTLILSIIDGKQRLYLSRPNEPLYELKDEEVYELMKELNDIMKHYSFQF